MLHCVAHNSHHLFGGTPMAMETPICDWIMTILGQSKSRVPCAAGDDGEADAYDPEISPECREDSQHEIRQTEVGPSTSDRQTDMKLTLLHNM